MTENFNTLTIGQYLDIVAANNDDSLSPLDMQVRIISILSGLSEEEVLHLPLGEYKEMSRKAAFLSGHDLKGTRVAEQYRIGKLTLVPVSDWRKIETAQYIDFQSFLSAGMDEHIVDILSCLLIPKGHRYNDGYDMDAVKDAVREGMSIAEGAALVAFFLNLFRALIADSLRYCKSAIATMKRARRMTKANWEQLRTMERKVEELEGTLQNLGVGSATSMR